MKNSFNLDEMFMGPEAPLVLIAGPCVIENDHSAYEIAAYLKELSAALKIPLIFKASYDKANRTSVRSYRGPGLNEGLRILEWIKSDLDIPILSDVHRISEVAAAAQVLDILQIPAFLCRQTDLIAEIAKTGKPINIKKGQFLASWDIPNIVEKITTYGNRKILITERGTQFGYNNLVVDFRGIMIMHKMGYPVIFDATHSVQLPGGDGNRSGGQREFAPMLAKAAVAAGVDGIFVEVHKDPDQALCDGPNSLKLDDLNRLLSDLKAIRNVLR